MSTALTPGQHALLESTLRLTRDRLHAALQAQRGGVDRIAHAAALLEDDPHELREHEAERELDQLRCERLAGEIRAIDDALQRLPTAGYGRCIDCGTVIPFDRLQHQPQALRCLDCQTSREGAH